MTSGAIDLFTAPAPAGPAPTSREAAVRIQPKLGELRMRILTYVSQHDGTTREGIAEGMSLRLQTVCGRINELLNHNRKQTWSPLISQYGTKPTSSGSPAASLHVTPKGRALLEELDR